MSKLINVNIFIGSEDGVVFRDLRLLVADRYDEDGNMIKTEFMKTVSWDYYEPGCIECICKDETHKIDMVLQGSSYLEKFVHLLPSTFCRYAILVYSPNEVSGRDYNYLKYINSYEFQIK